LSVNSEEVAAEEEEQLELMKPRKRR
jgi:hypothetical protein